MDCLPVFRSIHFWLPAVPGPVLGSVDIQPWRNFSGDTMSTERRKYVRSLCDWESRPIEWLWPGRVAAGKLTLIDGDPSQGKSLLALDLMARLTAARPLPD